MSDYRYAVDPIFDDNSEWVKCKACEREYDRKEYKSDTCVECESELTIKERGRVMNKLPKRINVTKVVSYDVDKIVGDIKDMGREEEITLESILDYIDSWVKEDFGSEHELIFTDEDGEELQ